MLRSCRWASEQNLLNKSDPENLCRQGAGAGEQVGERWRWILGVACFRGRCERVAVCQRPLSVKPPEPSSLLLSLIQGWTLDTPPRNTCCSWFPPEIAKTTGRLRFAGHNGHKIQSTNTYNLNALDLMMNY